MSCCSSRGWAADSGEGRWTVEAAIDNAVPMPVITAALFARFTSRQDDSPAMKVVAALRNQFGGHAVLAETEKHEVKRHTTGGDEAHPERRGRGNDIGQCAARRDRQAERPAHRAAQLDPLVALGAD